MSGVRYTCPSQDVTDAEPESLAEDDEKELSVVHPARPTTDSVEPREPWEPEEKTRLGFGVMFFIFHERDSWVFWWIFESGSKPGRTAQDV